jgi:hypothetical protein
MSDSRSYVVIVERDVLVRVRASVPGSVARCQAQPTDPGSRGLDVLNITDVEEPL